MPRKPVHFVSLDELGPLPVASLHDWQHSFVEHYRWNALEKKILPSVVLGFTFRPTITFGASGKDNRLSEGFARALADELKVPIKDLYSGDDLSPDAIECLSALGMDYYRSNRGGGATYLGPGQRSYFLVLDITSLAEAKGGDIPLESAVDSYASIMERVGSNILPDKQIGIDAPHDLYVLENGVKRKLGSRGLRLHRIADRFLTKYGMSYHLTEEGVQAAQYIDPCGISPEEGPVASFESLERSVSAAQVDALMRQAIGNVFDAEVVPHESVRNAYREPVLDYFNSWRPKSQESPEYTPASSSARVDSS